MSARVESKFTIPTGGAACSVSTGALSTAVTVTTPAASHYHTAAGGVTSWATVFQTTLNAAVSPYPDSAAAMQSAVGYGTWSSAWLCQEASGSLAPAFGATSLAPVSTPTYRLVAGPGTGTDWCVGFDSTLDAFSGGDIHDITDTDDVCIAWVAFVHTAPVAVRVVVSKRLAAAGWHVNLNSDGTYYFDGYDAAAAQLFIATGASAHVGGWHVGIATIDRATGKARIGTRSLAGVTSVSAEATAIATTMGNAANFQLGDRALADGLAPTTLSAAALYVGVGSGAADGLSANLSTALTNFANAVNASFTVALDTASGTGRYTISNSFWPFDLAWTSTAQRDVAGYDRDITYPLTAAQLATAVGYGNIAGGAAWLCNDTATPLLATYGTPSLAAASTPSYSNQGARGGTDKSVGFDSAGDEFSGGDVHDVSATQDLFVAMVVRATSVGATGAIRLMIKLSALSPMLGYQIDLHTDGSIRLSVGDGVDGQTVSAASFPNNKWCAVIAYLDRATNVAQIGFCPFDGSSPTVSSQGSTTAVGSLECAGSFALGGNLTAPQTWFCSAAYLAIGTSVVGSISANLSTALSNFATYMRSQTSTQQCKGLVFLDCPLNLDGDPSQAPRVSDLRTTMSPTGVTLGLSGNSYFQHTGLVWSHVARDRVWESAATYDNGSWETFFLDTQMGFGHSWFTPASPIQIYYASGGVDVLLGADYNGGTGLSGWTIVNVASIEPKKSVDGWTGLFRIELPKIVSAG